MSGWEINYPYRSSGARMNAPADDSQSRCGERLLLMSSLTEKCVGRIKSSNTWGNPRRLFSFVHTSFPSSSFLLRLEVGWEMRRVNWSARSPAVWIAAAGCCWLIWNMVVSRISEPAGNWSQQRRDGDPSQPVPHSERFVTYRSTVCDCVRNRSENIQLASKHSQFNWCGPESTLRGVEQKVVAFSIFGKADEKGSRYYSFLRDNAVTVNQVLPGRASQLKNWKESEHFLSLTSRLDHETAS